MRGACHKGEDVRTIQIQNDNGKGTVISKVGGSLAGQIHVIKKGAV
jgi:hypothetical protein